MMLMQTARRLSRQPAIQPLYRVLRTIYYNHLSTFLHHRRSVLEHSPYQNIYYCCTQKTGSQWFKRVFRDPVVYQHTGLTTEEYNELGLRQAHFHGPLSEHTIATHLYISHPTYLEIPKPERYRTFFILRDPRDIAVSWYFSARYSHGPVGPILKLRQELEHLDLREGLKHSITSLDQIGLFEAQRSWMQVPHDERDFGVFRYEDFVQDNRAFLSDLFQYLRIEIPDKKFQLLCERHQFKHMTGGRDQGTEDIQDHYRKGIAGDWQNYFDKPLEIYFREMTGDLLEVLGYQEQ